MKEGGFKALGIEWHVHNAPLANTNKHTHTPTRVTQPPMCAGNQKVRAFTSGLFYENALIGNLHWNSYIQSFLVDV